MSAALSLCAETCDASRHNAANKTIELINENTMEQKKHQVCAVWTKRKIYWHEVRAAPSV